MHIKKVKPLILSVNMLISLSIFTGCIDTGAFVDDEEYYDSFGTITLINESGAKTEFDLREDFYNAETFENMETSVTSDYYVFFCIEIKREMQLSEMNISIKSETSVQAEFSYFILSSIPTDIPTYDMTAPVLEDDDPMAKAVTSGKCALNKDIWDSFGANNVGKTDEETGEKTVSVGDIICIRFDNNTCYGKENGLTKYSFVLTNFIVRAI